MNIRPIKTREIPLLTEFLYEAIFQKDEREPVPRTILQEPGIFLYIDEFGTLPDDYCLVAEVDDKIVGAVWVRCIKGYGHIDDEVPEFAISVYPEHRGRGIGTRLLNAMLDSLREKGVALASLSVQKDNPAKRLYQRAGFEPIREHETEVIMVCRLDQT